MKFDIPMYFYLSKTLGFLAFPSNVIMVIVILGLLMWRTRYGKRITVVGILLLLIGGMTPIGTALLLPLENRFPQWDPARGSPDGMIVLGGVLNAHISRHRHNISMDSSAERLFAAVDLERRYPAARILFSGGNSNLIFMGTSEADLAVPFLERLGVPSDHILVDRTSRNTMENVVNSKNLAAPKPGERWLLITSAFHMPRAIGLFRAAGFPVEAYPVDWKTGSWRDVAAVPTSPLGGIASLDVASREWTALLINWMMGRTSALFPGPADTASAR
jgi:uncharacterized SAM-binding protein YcdF (DUF218 family)